jgi:hypothetical protein
MHLLPNVNVHISFLLLHRQFIQIVECRKLEVRYIFFEIKYRYKVDSNSINYIGD